ncbi:MAG: hypothetical protein K2N48_12840 [Muribaculaceae bacterium]|nr:hypothetical protein [Muribaculaceae bacterium]
MRCTRRVFLGSCDQRLIYQKLKSICNRRNQIVHEADFDTLSGSRRPITRHEVVDTTKFIQDFISTVHTLVS